MSVFPTITLNDGHVMPQIGLGVLNMRSDAEALVRMALDIGYPAVDTAMIYRNESEVGRAVRSINRATFVTTKLWVTDMGANAADAFRASLDRLQLNQIDLYLIHWPAPARGDDYLTTWTALVDLQKEDPRLRSIGVSNFRAQELHAIIDATGVVPAVNQIELHPRFQQRELRSLHEELGIVTTSWAPLGQGGVFEQPVLLRIAEKHGKTPAQIIIRWHIQCGLVVIPKSENPVRLAENIAVFDFVLDETDMEQIASLDRPHGRTGPDPADFNM